MITVVGSINMDLVTRVAAFPRPGETVSGTDLETIAGGKGANQAIAAARAGGRVQFVGAVGDDRFGPVLKRGLRAENIDVRRVRVEPRAATGVALITIGPGGENQIVVSPGANRLVTPRRVDEAEPLIARSRLLLLQREVPPATVTRALTVAQRRGVLAVLNPAPAAALSRQLLSRVGILVVNETEADLILGETSTPPRRAVLELAGRTGGQTAILTRGGRGAWVMAPELRSPTRVPAFKVKVVDTTGAGDTFVGALAARHLDGDDLLEAVRFATAAAALSVSRLGATPSIPTRNRIERFRRRATECP